MFAEKGFTCLEVDLAVPDPVPSTSEALLDHFDKGASWRNGVIVGRT
jgi:hypothetical protein